MRVHIVEPYNSHAMKRMASPLLSLPYEVSISKDPDANADVNIHIPWHTMREGGKNIIAYTHVNPPDKLKLLEACDKADAITAMSECGKEELIDFGVDPSKIHVVYCGADYQFRKRVIGVVGTVQPNGRKGESILLDLAWNYDLSPYEFLIVGQGWEETGKKLISLGVSLKYIEGANDEQMQTIYNAMDVLLSTGYTEGGPLPVLEALAAGVPVISKDYGFASDFLSKHYRTHADIWDMLNGLFYDVIQNRKQVEDLTWSNYVKDYQKIIEGLYA